MECAEEINVLVKYSPRREHFLGSRRRQIDCQNGDIHQANIILKLSETQ